MYLSYLSDDAFLLSEPHVTAMFQCLEAVEQNNPKLLAQVDTVGVGLMQLRWWCVMSPDDDDLKIGFYALLSLQLSPLKGPPCLGLLKSQSLCVLPGAGGAWKTRDSAPRGEPLNRRLTTSNCSLREAVSTSHKSGNTTGDGSLISSSTSEQKLKRDNGFF